jgi:ankyrin repeat protein
MDLINKIYLSKTPLTYALSINFGTIAEYLIELGVDINKTDGWGWTPLHHAYFKGNTKIIKILVDHGADINKCGKYKGIDTPLIFSLTSEYTIAIHNRFDVTTCLIDLGADLNKKSMDGYTPLIKVCQKEDQYLMEYLVEHGADVNQHDRNKNIPLIIACQKENKKIIKYFVEHGANVNVKNKKGDTPLTIANRNKDEDIAKYLLEHGTDIHFKSDYGFIPLYILAINIVSLSIFLTKKYNN